MSKKKGMILLSGYAKSIGLSIEETRALLRKPEYREFYSEIGGKYTEPQIEIGTDYDEETDEQVDIYQYFIVDFSSWTYELMTKYKEQFGKEFILYYIEELELYILGITHFGTGWDYVLTDIEPSEDMENTQF